MAAAIEGSGGDLALVNEEGMREHAEEEPEEESQEVRMHMDKPLFIEGQADDDGLPAVLEAVETGNTEAVQQFVRTHSADTIGDDMSLLCRAVQYGQRDVLTVLLDAGARVELVQGEGEDSEGTALHMAAGSLARDTAFALEALELMLARLSVPIDDLRDGVGRSVLATAVKQSLDQRMDETALLAAVRMLLEAGSSVSAVETPQHAETHNANNAHDAHVSPRESVLHSAAECAPQACVRLLLQARADPVGVIRSLQ
eukprot:6211838-Pleurochrysis_carterae.AAC.1